MMNTLDGIMYIFVKSDVQTSVCTYANYLLILSLFKST